MRAPGGERDHEGVLVDAAEPVERVLPGARHDLGADVEQREQVAQVAGEERHLLYPDDHHALRGGERADARLDLLAGQAACGLLDVRVVARERRLELRVVEVEELCGAVSVGSAAAVLLDRRLLELGVALEPKRLREADDGRGRGVGAARQLLSRLEGGLLEMVDDVAGDVLLRARELVEALGDELRERLGARGARPPPVSRLGCGLGHGTVGFDACGDFPFRLVESTAEIAMAQRRPLPPVSGLLHGR